MEREKFVNALSKASDSLDINRYKDVLKRSINSQIDNETSVKYYSIICMEELAELIQEISKSARGMGDKTGLLEEMADVMIVLDELREIYSIDMSEIYKAINVKIDRLENVLNEKGVYQ